MEALVVECTVCHVVGLMEAGPVPQGPPGTWPRLRCCFTDACVGHVWPEFPN